jgi:hypothetical protein
MNNPREAKVKEQRPTRTPLGARNRMTVDGLTDREDFVYRWVNDVNAKPQACVDAGWIFVPKKGLSVGDVDVESGKGMGSVETKYVGQGVKAFLMKQDRITWEADRKARVDDPTDATEVAQTQDRANQERGSVKIASRASKTPELKE